MGNVKLTKEEEIIKRNYGKFVNRGRIMGRLTNRDIEKFANEYKEAFLSNTKFKDQKIRIEREDNAENYGSMIAKENGKESILKISYKEFLDKKRGLNSKDNLTRFNAFLGLVNTLNHENTHYLQFKNVENFVLSNGGMTFSKFIEIANEDVASITDRYMFYDADKGNYKNIGFEGEARREGTIKTATQFFRAVPGMNSNKRNMVIGSVMESIKKDTIDFEKLKFDDSSREYDRATVISLYVDEFVSANPDILRKNRYAPLRFQYAEDGTRYDFHEILDVKNEFLSKLDKIDKSMGYTPQDIDIIKNQYQAGFSQVMYNSLLHCNEDYTDIRRRIGDERFLKEIEYIREGRNIEARERLDSYEKYIQFFNANEKRISKKVQSDAMYKLNDIAAKNNFYITVDEKTGKNKCEINSVQIENLDNLKNYIENAEPLPLYTQSELEASDIERVEYKQAFKRERIQDYEDRKKRIKKDKVREKRLIQEEKQRQLQERMKNPLFRVARKIAMTIMGNKQKTLPSASSTKYGNLITEQRNEYNTLVDQKNELENNYLNIKEEAGPILEQAENKIYLDKQETYEKRGNSREEITSEKEK